MGTERGAWVSGLTPGEGPAAVPVTHADVIASAIHRVGDEPVQWAVNLGHAIAARALEVDSEFGTGEAALRTMQMGTEAAAVQMLLGIAVGGLDEVGDPLVREEMIAEFVARRIPLERVWASIRHGHAWLTDVFMSECRRLVPPPAQPDELQLISQVVFAWVNRFADGVGRAYHDEERRWLSSAAAARDETVRAILDGTLTDPRAATSTLRYELAHYHHLALILCQERIPGASDTTDLHRVAEFALEAAGATSTLIMPVGRSELWAWGGSPVAFTDVTQRLAKVELGGVPAVAGQPGRGLDGFRRTHAQAQEAWRVMLSSAHRPDRIVPYSAVSLIALLLTDPDQASLFVRDELGRLAEDDPQTESLRETVLAFLEHRRSPQVTASHLFVAKNTVVYRIKRAEELLGRSTELRQAELWTALLLVKTLGAARVAAAQWPPPAQDPA